jgi:16S rRNA (uracil1498-N3)-methyltransferase
MEYYFTETPVIGKKIILLGDEHQHCSKVKRHKKGDIIQILDGKGNQYLSEISEIKRNETILDIVETAFENPEANRIIIAISPTKNPSRLEWFVEKATEIGATGLMFIQCERTDKKSLKEDRIKKIIISSIKQCGRKYLPELYFLSSIQEISNCIDANDFQKYIAHCGKNENHLIQITDSSKNQIVLIGPEGDFTAGEILWALNNGFNPVSLGTNRLRTETAGIYSLVCLRMRSQNG